MMYKTLFLLAVVCLVESCLITNCPKGGKRSVQSGLRDPDCRRCGPGLEGRCLGRMVCCGPRMGCMIGSPAVFSQCASEPQNLGVVRGAQKCSIGVCLSDGICCSPSGCKLDFTCEMDQSTDVCTVNDIQSF